jgi:hypothetical protein
LSTGVATANVAVKVTLGSITQASRVLRANLLEKVKVVVKVVRVRAKEKAKAKAKVSPRVKANPRAGQPVSEVMVPKTPLPMGSGMPMPMPKMVIGGIMTRSIGKVMTKELRRSGTRKLRPMMRVTTLSRRRPQRLLAERGRHSLRVPVVRFSLSLGSILTPFFQ